MYRHLPPLAQDIHWFVFETSSWSARKAALSASRLRPSTLGSRFFVMPSTAPAATTLRTSPIPSSTEGSSGTFVRTESAATSANAPQFDVLAQMRCVHSVTHGCSIGGTPSGAALGTCSRRRPIPISFPPSPIPMLAPAIRSKMASIFALACEKSSPRMFRHVPSAVRPQRSMATATPGLRSLMIRSAAAADSAASPMGNSKTSTPSGASASTQAREKESVMSVARRPRSTTAFAKAAAPGGPSVSGADADAM
mmetsp:Transcript_19515/g.63418  ORF Transcript_19515/g.63418 Transcript_19515/m.63418 type:complete len:253 (+) Transcript_19515:43-801(+)